MLKEWIVQVGIKAPGKCGIGLNPLNSICKLQNFSSFDGLKIVLCQVDLNDLFKKRRE